MYSNTLGWKEGAIFFTPKWLNRSASLADIQWGAPYMTSLGPVGELSSAKGPSARRVLAWALTIQSLSTLAITLGILVAQAGIDSRFLLFVGLLVGVGVATGIATWLSLRIFGPLERLISQAEDLAAGRPAGTAPLHGPVTWMQPDDISRLSVALLALQSGKRPANTATPRADSERPTGASKGESVDTTAQFAAVLQLVPWAMWITDREGKITHHNALAVELFESESNDLRGFAMDSWFVRRAGAEAWSELRRGVLGGTQWRNEIDVATADHDSLRMEITAGPVQTADKVQGVLFLAEDVTEIQQLGKVLIDLERQSTRGEMAGEVAHEINNFLTILGGNLDIIPMLMAKGQHEKVQGKFVAMRQVLDKIARFSDGLMGPRDMAQEASTCDLNRLIENLSEFLKPQNRFDGVELAVLLDLELPKVVVRVGEINQVLVNLLNNAADAIHQDGRRDGRVEISTRHLPERGEFAVTVKDDGPGLSSDASEHIFRDRYSEKKSGHGLGLLNCHAIARGHGGQLTVETTPGQGTSFTLTLPCGQAEPERESTSALFGAR